MRSILSFINLKRDILIPAVFLAGCTFVYPLLPFKIFVPVTGDTYLRLFSPASIALLALVLLLLNPLKLWSFFYSGIPVWICFLFIFLISCLHFWRIERFSFENFCFSMFFPAAALIGWIYSNSFLRILPFYITGLWLLNLLHLFIRFFFFDQSILFGLSGNINWNAAFMLASLPFVLYLTGRYFERTVLLKSFLCIAASISTLCIIVLCSSRAAVLALVVGSLVFLCTKVKKRSFFLIVILLGCLSAAAFFTLNKDSAARIIAEDVRVPLWEGTVQMIQDNLLTGVSPSLFESEFASYSPPDYFLRRVSAVRNNHPHNHFLYFAASYGVVAFISWGFIMIFPLLFFVLNYRNRTLLEKVVFYGFLFLFVQSMFDLIFYEWPTNFIGMLLLGIIWSVVWPPKEESVHDKKILPVFIFFCEVSAVVLAVFMFFMLKTQFMASKNLRSGIVYSERNGDDYLAAYFLDQAVKYKSDDPTILYKAAMHSYFSLDDPHMALGYLLKFANDTPVVNYAHNNAFAGKILIETGRVGEGTVFLEREVRNYPLSTTARYFLYVAYKRLGYEDMAADTYKKMLITLKYKGMTEENLKDILENPQYDQKPYLFHEKKREPIDTKKGD